MLVDCTSGGPFYSGLCSHRMLLCVLPVLPHQPEQIPAAKAYGCLAPQKSCTGLTWSHLWSFLCLKCETPLLRFAFIRCCSLTPFCTSYVD